MNDFKIHFKTDVCVFVIAGILIFAVLCMCGLSGCEQEPSGGCNFKEGDIVAHKIDPNSRGLITRIAWDPCSGRYVVNVRFKVGGGQESFHVNELVSIQTYGDKEKVSPSVDQKVGIVYE